MHRYRADEATARERQLVERWYASLDSEQIADQDTLPIRQEKNLNLLLQTIDNRPVRLRSNRRIYQMVAGLAAAILLCLTALYWVAPSPRTVGSVPEEAYQSFQTGVGERKRITLPDGSTVTLNSRTQIRIDLHRYNKANRTVQLLDGEAYFDVEKDSARAFVVQSDGLETSVLGTTFTVQSYLDHPEQKVSVFTGRVQVTKADRMLGVIQKGEQIRFEKKGANAKTETFDLNNRNAWIAGKVFLKQAAFSELALVLRNNYGVELRAGNSKVEHQYYTLPIHRQIALDNVLQTIAKIHDNQLRREGNVVIVF